ncbi:MAG: hypothetical protein J0665_16325 [Deltaproteobacteria bacterium]|nr:hypothetical protein [Deltaproteobacteria bacterium]
MGDQLYTLISEDFKFVGFKAVTPYKIDESAYFLLALPPAPVGRHNMRDLLIQTYFLGR